MDKDNEKLLVSGIIVIGLLTVVVVFITLNSQPAPQAPTRYCGDGTCDSMESCSNCPQDCGTCPTSRETELPTVEDGNFVLYVSSQSFAINPVDIKIYIDDKVAVDDIFDVTGNRTPQHNWQKYQFQLESGSHTIKAVSETGDAVLEEEFDIVDKHWVVVDYWYYPEVTGGSGPTPKQFTFNIQDSPIGFM